MKDYTQLTELWHVQMRTSVALAEAALDGAAQLAVLSCSTIKQAVAASARVGENPDAWPEILRRAADGEAAARCIEDATRIMVATQHRMAAALAQNAAAMTGAPDAAKNGTTPAPETPSNVASVDFLERRRGMDRRRTVTSDPGKPPRRSH